MIQLICERCSKSIPGPSNFVTFGVGRPLAATYLCERCSKPVRAALKRLKVLPAEK